jgi:hypothetical protein
MHFSKKSDMYHRYDINILDTQNLDNRLFCTFVKKNDLDSLLEEITSGYDIMHNKIFILYINSNDEYACTYNVENNDINHILDGTILVHRKKETNTLYTINSLNEIIKYFNNGIVDSNFIINWMNYKNSILLTQNNAFKQLKTKLYKIVEL